MLKFILSACIALVLFGNANMVSAEENIALASIDNVAQEGATQPLGSMAPADMLSTFIVLELKLLKIKREIAAKELELSQKETNHRSDSIKQFRQLNDLMSGNTEEQKIERARNQHLNLGVFLGFFERTEPETIRWSKPFVCLLDIFSIGKVQWSVFGLVLSTCLGAMTRSMLKSKIQKVR